MPGSRKTHYVKKHCRSIKAGRKAKSPCTTKKGGSGTSIKGHYSPKMSRNIHAAAAKIQSLARARSARKAVSAKRSASAKKAAKIAKALKMLA